MGEFLLRNGCSFEMHGRDSCRLGRGTALYARVRPFFLGMMLGEFCFAIFSVLLNILLFKTLPHAFPRT